MEQSGWYQEWLAMDPAIRGSMRTYTVRSERLDAVYPEIDVDFVMHFDADGNGGPAANWAQNARPGDALTIIGPNNRAAHCVTAETYAGIEWRPGLAQRVLLAGDETAVPAISAILESLPAVHDRPRLPGGPRGRRLPGSQVTPPTSKSPGLPAAPPSAAPARTASCCRKPSAQPFPCPGWVGVKAADGGAGPEPEDVNVDQDILWETPAPDGRRGDREPPRTRTCPPVPCRSTPGSPAKRPSSRTCAGTWCGTSGSTGNRLRSWATGGRAKPRADRSSRPT